MEKEKDVKFRVLCVCMYNSGRSQMAEAYINAMAAGCFRADSAGMKPRDLDALVLTVMKEDGIDLSRKGSHHIMAYWEKQRRYDYIISLNDRDVMSNCPIFPGNPRQLFWPYPDHRLFPGSRLEKLEQFRNMRDQIKRQVRIWMESIRLAYSSTENVIPFDRVRAGIDKASLPVRQ